MMQSARFVLTPYYEVMDTIFPIRRLFLDECASLDTNGRLRGRQLIEFNVRYNHSLLLSESKRQKISSFNIRSVIRFCKADEMRCDEHGIRVKDAFPLHLNIDLNNTMITLPNLLPNDRFGKDGRRFPRPVDLTEGLIDNPIIKNRMYITWVQDESRHDEYYFAMYIVRLRSCDELTTLLLSQHISTVKTTLSLVYDQCVNLNGAVDDDIMLVNTSINMSLNCPVSRTRMKIPIRGQNCNHLQCFDCMTYLVMNYKKPTWLCPVCDKKTFFCYVEVDGLIYNILKDDRSKTVEQIQFNKSGQWRPMKKTPVSTNDDKPYYDITDYIKQNQLEISAKKIPVPVTNEKYTDYKIEKYINQILNIPHNGTPIVNLTVPSNNKEPNYTVTPSTINGNPQVNLYHVNGGSNVVTMENIANITIANVAKNVARTSKNLSQFSSASLTSNLMKEYYDSMHYHQGPTNRSQPPFQYSHHSIIPTMASKLLVPCITSSDNRMKKNIIVISDDEEENSIKATTNQTKTAQKRPTTVSSLPSEVDPSKKLKLSDPCQPHFPRPSSQDITSKSPSRQCKCTPGRICQAHNEQFAFINRVMADSCTSMSDGSHNGQTDIVTSSTSSHPKNAHGPTCLPSTNIPVHSIVGTHVNNDLMSDRHVLPQCAMPRSTVTSEFNQAMFNRYLFNSMSNQMNLQSESISSDAPIMGHQASKPKDATKNLSSCSQEKLQAQWLHLINSCPMPYIDRGNKPPAMTPSISSSNSFTNPSNVFYSG